MEKYLIFNADDFGASTGINRGILESYTHGVVTSTSLMVKGIAVREAVSMGRDHPTLAVGLHFDVWDDDGPVIDIHNHQTIRDHFSRQVDEFQRLMGRMPTHVDTHHHFHRTKKMIPLFRELMEPVGVPLRAAGAIPFNGGFYGQPEWQVTNLECVSVPFLDRMLREEVGEGWTEFGCHPGYVSPDYTAVYLAERKAEVRTLTDPRIRGTIEELGIRLVSYADYRAVVGA